MFGKKAQPPAAARKQQAPAIQFDPSDYPKEGTCSICFGFFFFLLVVPVSIVFFYHSFPTTVILLNLIWICITLGPWAFHAGGAVVSDLSGPMLTVVLFLSVVLAFCHSVGCYYTNAEPLRQLMFSRSYHGVYPESPASDFPDAAFMTFAGNASIDTTKAVTYQSLNGRLSTLCIAPVVTPLSTGRIGYWAIGVDCCGKNGEKFECYDAGEEGVKTGWVMPNTHDDPLYSTLGIYVTPVISQRRELYVEALQKAEAILGVTTPGDEAVFLRWTKQTRDELIAYKIFRVVLMVVISILWMAVMSFVMTRLYQKFSHVRKIHRKQHHFGLHGDMANSEEEGMTERLQQFMADSLEGASGSDMSGTINRVKGMAKGEGIDKFRPPLSASDMCIMGVVVPYVVLMSCVILSTYAPCAKFGLVIESIFWCLTFVFIMALLATPHRTITGLFIMLCCTAGYYIGQSNYKENMFHYCNTDNRQTYEGVSASDSTDIFWDAGMLKFNENAQISAEHSVGFLYEGTSYCAAPVLSQNAPCNDVYVAPTVAPATITMSDASLLQVTANHTRKAAKGKVKQLAAGPESPEVGTQHLNSPPTFMQRRSSSRHVRQHPQWELVDPTSLKCQKPAPKQVEFWAVGTDCCEARKKFWCDGSKVKGAHEAVVVRAYEASEGPNDKSDREHFFQAIDQAVATFDFPAPNRAVLLRWGESSKALQADWHSKALGIIFMTGLVSMLVILGIGMISFVYTKRQRKLADGEMTNYGAKASGKATEPTVYDGYASPRPSLPPAGTGNADAEILRRLQQSEDELRF